MRNKSLSTHKSCGICPLHSNLVQSPTVSGTIKPERQLTGETELTYFTDLSKSVRRTAEGFIVVSKRTQLSPWEKKTLPPERLLTNVERFPTSASNSYIR